MWTSLYSRRSRNRKMKANKRRKGKGKESGGEGNGEGDRRISISPGERKRRINRVGRWFLTEIENGRMGETNRIFSIKRL